MNQDSKEAVSQMKEIEKTAKQNDLADAAKDDLSEAASQLHELPEAAKQIRSPIHDRDVIEDKFEEAKERLQKVIRTEAKKALEDR